MSMFRRPETRVVERDGGTPRLVVVFAESGRTKQSMRAECDINNILGKYAKGGVIDHLAKYGGEFGTVEPMTFHEAMNLVTKAQEMFADLDSGIRKRFGNDPGAFLEFAQDPKNIDELRKMGLAKAAPEPVPGPVEARVAELEVDRQARVELARKAITEPPAAAPSTVAT